MWAVTLPSTALTIEDLSVELGGLPVLRGITVTVHPGETVALLGGNGSGKSTLVRALMGLLPTQRGSITLFDVPQRQFNDWAAIGYVPQKSTAALSGAKVKEIVGSGRLSMRRPFLPATRKDRVAVTDGLSKVGLAPLANREMARLSGGQQQRVLIARALVNQPRLLVLDEPTAGVDLEHQQVLTSVIADMIENGTAVLVVLHEIGALSSLINRAVVLRDGRVVHDGAFVDRNHDHQHVGGHEYETPVDLGWLDGTVER